VSDLAKEPGQNLNAFSQRARTVLRRANELAEQLGHSSAATGHCLIAILQEGSGIAAGVLKSGFTPDQELMRVTLQALPPYDGDNVSLIDEAINQARMRGSTFVGTEHLLLAAICRNDSSAAQLLATCHIDLKDLRDALVSVVADDALCADYNLIMSMESVYPLVQQALITCCASLPKEKRSRELVESRVRGFVERAFESISEDFKHFS
jgi:ATP-dependent Clp protease ATP-binding subunit ClpA